MGIAPHDFNRGAKYTPQKENRFNGFKEIHQDEPLINQDMDTQRTWNQRAKTTNQRQY